MIRTFLFWNLNKKPLENLITQLAEQYKIDVLILAESTIQPSTLLSALNTQETIYHYAPGRECKKIDVYTRFNDRLIRPLLEADRTTIRRLEFPDAPEIILVATHGPSKLYWSEDDQFAECIELSRFIRQIEEDLGHTRTVLVGDFNMNPFEKGMVASNGLHAIMSKRIARQEVRTVKGVRYPFFYNPMWSLFGDIPSAPPGTYFYNRSGRPLNYFWNMFDQVMLRPSLLEAFKDDHLRILESVGDFSLLSSRGTPDPTKASDHLPLLFAFDL